MGPLLPPSRSYRRQQGASLRWAMVASATLALAFVVPASPGAKAAPALFEPGTIYVTDAAHNAIFEFSPGSNGNVAPAVTIKGSNTGLSEPEGVASAPSSGEIVVANAAANSITEYTIDVSGNALPDATISGSNTNLSFPQGVAVDPAGDIFVANNIGLSVTEYAPGTAGNMAPIATIFGSGTLPDHPHGIALD